VFRCTCITFREHNVPVLKPSANDELLLYKVLQFVIAPLMMSVKYKKYNLYRLLKTYG